MDIPIKVPRDNSISTIFDNAFPIIKDGNNTKVKW